MTLKKIFLFAFFVSAPLSITYGQNIPAPEVPTIDQEQIDPSATYEITTAKDLTEFYKTRPLMGGLTRDADGRVLSTKQTEEVQGANLHQFERDQSMLGRTVVSVTKK